MRAGVQLDFSTGIRTRFAPLMPEAGIDRTLLDSCVGSRVYTPWACILHMYHLLVAAYIPEFFSSAVWSTESFENTLGQLYGAVEL